MSWDNIHSFLKNNSSKVNIATAGFGTLGAATGVAAVYSFAEGNPELGEMYSQISLASAGTATATGLGDIYGSYSGDEKSE